MGGQADAVTGHLREHFHSGMGLSDALGRCPALSAVSPVTAGATNGGPTRLTAAQLEVALLDRRRPKRAFRRITGAALRTLLGDEAAPTPGTARHAPTAHAPTVSEPGTPPGLGDPANPDTAGGGETRRGVTVPNYRVNKDAVAQARKLIDAGKFDDDTEWSDAARPPTTATRRSRSTAGRAYGAWHLAIDPDATEETKGRTRSPTATSPGSTGPPSSTASSAPQNGRRDREGLRRPPAAPRREAVLALRRFIRS